MTELEQYHYDQAREWLEHVRRLKVACDRAQAMVEVMERIADSVGAIDYSREKVSGSPSVQGIEDAVMRLEEMRREFAANRAAYGAEAVDAANRLGGMEDPAESLALLLHYCDGMEWAEVARRMCYSEARIYEIRKAGVLHAYEVMPLEWRDPMPPAV